MCNVCLVVVFYGVVSYVVLLKFISSFRKISNVGCCLLGYVYLISIKNIGLILMISVVMFDGI